MKSLTKFIHESYYGADGETERRAGADHSFQNSKFKNSAALVAAVKKYDLKKSVLSKIQDDARIKEGSRTNFFVVSKSGFDDIESAVSTLSSNMKQMKIIHNSDFVFSIQDKNTILAQMK